MPKRPVPRRRSLPVFEPVEPRTLLTTVPTGFTETAIASGLTSPTAMDLAADGRVFLATQGGQVRVIENDQLLSAPFADFSAQTDGSGERGMLGIALAPDFATSRHVYVYYTANSPFSHNRLSRLTADPTDPNTMLPGSEVPLLDLPSIGSAISHMGGSIQFGPDGKLYIAVGDHQQSASAQSMSSVFGKILRVNSDGTIPADNPFYNTAPAGITQAIWALGLRNPYTTAFQPGTGRFFINDVGEGTWEEINDGVAGANYGWPATEGDFNQASFPAYTRPFHVYDHTGGKNAITGGAFYNPATSQFPAQYVGDYFFVDLGTGQMWNIDPATKALASFATDMTRPTNVQISNDGSLYYLSQGPGGVFKIEYVSDTPPSVVQHPQDKLVSVGQSAVFTVSASGSTPLSYQWTRDGVDIPGATSSVYTLNNAQLADDNAVFRARVSNGFGTETSDPATLDVTTNAPPLATISAPPNGATYRAGDVINFSGSATDAEDGNLAPANMTWWVDFHHNTHFHPFVPAASGSAGGSFQIPQIGEQAPDVWYRIHLRVTDSIGLEHHVFRDVNPITSALTISSNVPGVTFTLDGQPQQMPHTLVGVAGLIRGVSIDPIQSVGGQWYEFTGWSDGGAAAHDFEFPDVDTTLTATFAPLGGIVYVSDLPYAATPTNGFGPIERDRSNGNTGAADGNTIRLNGVTYAKGLGVHASTGAEPISRATFHLDGAYVRFLSDVGVDDETANTAASVVFQVFADGVKVYDSGTMTATSPTKSIDLNVNGVRVLELVITDAGNGKTADHGDWAGALLLLRPGPSAPAAHYEFDDGSGTTIRDLSSNANHGTSAGTVTFVPGHIAKNALNFNGSTGIVTAANGSQLNPTSAITVAAWINPTSWAGGDRRIIQKGDANTQYMLGAIGGQLAWQITGKGTVTAPLPATGTWRHVAGTYDGTALRLYVDGALVGAIAASGAIPVTTNPLTIGGRNGGAATERFNGAIDDVRLYNRAVGAAELYDLSHPINVNFQLAGAPTPAGYLADTGLVFADRGNGQAYGWNVSHADNARDRNSAAQPDQRLDTLNQFKVNGKWEIALPNGQYLVYLSVGDPSFGSFTPTLNVEGFNVYTNQTTATNSYLFTSRIVTVSDGRLTIDQGTDADKDLRPNYIQVYRITPAQVTPAWLSASPDAVYTLDSSALNVTGGTVTFTGDASVTHPSLDVSVGAGANVVFNTTQRIGALDVIGSASMTGGGDKMLVTEWLDIAAAGQLNLADNDLLIDYTGASPYAAINDYAASGRSTGFGIVSAAVPGGDMVLAVADNVHLAATTFGDIPIDETTIVCRYTYFGDANMDGIVTTDDYVAVDLNLGRTSPQWVHGDVDMNGAVTTDDYVVIDLNLGKGTSQATSAATIDVDEFEVAVTGNRSRRRIHRGR